MRGARSRAQTDPVPPATRTAPVHTAAAGVLYFADLCALLLGPRELSRRYGAVRSPSASIISSSCPPHPATMKLSSIPRRRVSPRLVVRCSLTTRSLLAWLVHVQARNKCPDPFTVIAKSFGALATGHRSRSLDLPRSDDCGASGPLIACGRYVDIVQGKCLSMEDGLSPFEISETLSWLSTINFRSWN